MKEKRKEQPNIQPYSFIFGVLLLLLIVLVWFPIRFTNYWWLNHVLYGSIGIASLITAVHLVWRYGWQQKLIASIIACILLSGWLAYRSPTQLGFEPSFCSTEEKGLLVYHHCIYIGNCPTLELAFVGIKGVPILIKTFDYYVNPCDYPRPNNWR